MPEPNFKVIIVGASIAGLTMANLLQKLGIEFVVLEAYGTVAPQLGASIGLHPHGLRILDQVGCYENILEFAANADKTTVRDETGRVLFSHKIARLVKERHGYPTIFLERRSTIQVLYDHIQDKSKVFVNQRVNHVELLGDGIRVRTTAGQMFDGSIVVGADGIHSAIREEMWRLANELEPGYIPAGVKDAIPTEWGCIFAISKPTGDIKATDINVTHKKGGTLACMCGQGDRPFWFYFFKLDKPHYGFPVPRFTKEDEQRIVEKEGDLPATEQVRLKDLFANVEFSTTTALPHHVYPQFFFERIFLVGDSVHKFNPLSGQGGNSAIETAAALADRLAKLAKEAEHGNKPSSAQIRAAFAEVQKSRQPRAQALVDASITAQRISAWDTPALKFVDTFVAPLLLDTPGLADQTSKPVVGGVRAHSLPLPSVPHTIPYNDELHRTPKPRTASGLVRVALHLGLLGVMIRLVLSMLSDGMLDRLHEAVKAGPRGDSSPQYSTPLNFDHVPLIGQNLSGLVANYFPATEMWHLDFRLLTFYLSISEFVVFAIWMLEACRARSKKPLSPSRWALPYGIVSHLSAVRIGAPLFFLLDTLATGAPAASWPTATHVEPHEARAILPALILGMLVPTLLAFAPFLESVTRQYVLVGWFFFPAALAILSKIFAAASSKNSAAADLRANRARSLAHVRVLFGFSFAISALAHLLTLGVALTSPDASISAVFLFRGELQGTGRLSAFAENHNAFLVDYYVLMASSLVWAVGCIRDLERNGLVAAVNWPGVFFGALGGAAVCGPAAVVSAICFWRETKMAWTPKTKGA
ncbi:Monooxygenase FAD-binding protein [Macrophomina phaseolina MS6]|uniref:Monooxygenase FAD-binding protein n=1 Tax=Macrophomina phaseolina (strain MS6) TaxID=1126212 RepID=K2RQW4_MACPH|nr:Monooxygenase FAD-binding protein [Macrophomina phaseolina MS6]